jgi:hypothetical protein
MGVIQQALTHLAPRIDGLMDDVINNEGAGAQEAWRAAGRLEQVLFEFIDGYLDTMASLPGPQTREATSLILGVYRHYIREICEWLEELAQAIADPASAIQHCGIAASAHVELTITLTLTSPPEMFELDALAKRLNRSSANYSVPAPSVAQPDASGTGLLGTIGAMAFGIGLSKVVFGRPHD